MLMALNRQFLQNSLLKVQKHIATSGNTIKVAELSVAKSLGSIQAKKASSFQQHSSSSDSEGDDPLKNNPYYSTYAEKLRLLKK